MPRSTAISAGAIILHEIDGQLKIALAQHKRSTKTWNLPKGHVEPGETLAQAALREIHEETGLTDIQLITHLGSILRQSTKNNGDTIHKTIHYYLAYALRITEHKGLLSWRTHPPVPTDKRFTTVGWFTPAEVLELLPYEQDRDFLKEHLGDLCS